MLKESVRKSLKKLNTWLLLNFLLFTAVSLPLNLVKSGKISQGPVWFLQQTEYEDFAIGVVFPNTGCAYDGHLAQSGISYLTAALVAEEIRKLWTPGDFHWVVHQDYSGFFFSGQLADFAHLFQASKKLFVAPKIAESTFQQVRDSVAENAEFSQLRERFFSPSAWTCDPLGKTVERKKLSLADVYKYFSRYYLWSNSYWFIVGNFSPTFIRKNLEDLGKEFPSFSVQANNWLPPPLFRESFIEVLSPSQQKNIIGYVACRAPLPPEVYVELYRFRFQKEVEARFAISSYPRWYTDHTSPIPLIILRWEIPTQHYPSAAQIMEAELLREPDAEELSALEQWLVRKQNEQAEQPLLRVQEWAEEFLRPSASDADRVQCSSIYFIPEKEEERTLKLASEFRLQKILPTGLKISIVEKKQESLSRLLFAYKRAFDRWYFLDPFFLFALPFSSTLSHSDFRSRLWQNAIRYSAGCDDVFCQVYLEFPSEKVQEAVELLYLLIARAVFPPTEFAHTIQMYLPADAQRNNEDEFLPFLSRIFPKTDFPIASTLDRNTALLKWRERVAPNNSILFLSGYFDAQQVLDEVEQQFGEWKGWEESEVLWDLEKWKGGERKEPFSPPRLWFAVPIPPYGSEEFWAFQIFRRVLHSRFQNWEGRNQTHSKEILYYLVPSVWLVSVKADEPLLTEWASIFSRTVEDFRQMKVQSEEWEQAKNLLLKEESEISRNPKLRTEIAAREFLMPSPAYSQKIRDIQKCSPKDAKRMSERYLFRAFFLIAE